MRPHAEARAISGAVVFRASEDAADITGVALPVDGGHLVLPSVNTSPVREPWAGPHRRGEIRPGAEATAAEIDRPVGPATASFRAAVREDEEVVPVDAAMTWVLPSGVAVGR